MARKDLRLMVEEAARGGQQLAMIPRWRRCSMRVLRGVRARWMWRRR